MNAYTKSVFRHLTSHENSKALFKHFAIIFALGLLICTPLLVGGAYYQDDYYRLGNGDVNYWGKNGRPLAVFLAHLIFQARVVPDTAPLFLIIGLTSLSALITFSMRHITEERGTPLVVLCIAILIGPFMAQPLLYTYDAMPILLAIGLSFLGCVIFSERYIVQFAISSGIFMAAACLYQTAVNHSLINIALSMMVAIVRERGLRRQSLYNALTLLCALFTAIAVYKVFIAPHFVIDDYNKMRALMVPFDLAGMRRAAENAYALFYAAVDALPGYCLVPVALIVTVGTAGCWKLGLQHRGPGAVTWERLVGMLFCLVVPVLVCAAIAGFLMFLKNASFDPRVLTASSSAMVFYFYVAYKAFPVGRALLAAGLKAYLLFSAVFMMTTFRAAINQYNFDHDLALSIRNDLSHMGEPAIRQVSIIGTSPMALATEPAFRRYPMLENIVFSAFHENSSFGYYGIMNLNGTTIPLGLTTAALKAYVPEKLFSSNCVYRLFRYKDTAVVDFTASLCPAPREPWGIPLRDPDD